MGKKFLIEGEYKEAMDFFELGFNRTYYSLAYEGYRNEQLEDNFLLVTSPIIFLMGYIIYTEIRYSRKAGE